MVVQSLWLIEMFQFHKFYALMKFYICLLCIYIYMVNFKYCKDTYLYCRVSMAWIVPLLWILRHRISNQSPSEKSSLVIYTYWKHQYYIIIECKITRAKLLKEIPFLQDRIHTFQCHWVHVKSTMPYSQKILYHCFFIHIFMFDGIIFQMPHEGVQ